MALEKTKQQPAKARIQLYDKEQLKRADQYSQWASDLISKKLKRSKFKKLMQDDLKRYYIQTALLGKNGRSLTARDRKDISRFLSQAYQYLNGFYNDLKGYKAKISEAQITARAASYSNSWGVFSRFTIPAVIADMLPALPGVDCLGGANCGCWLEWSVSGQVVEVRWFLTAFKEHCVNCMAFAAEWQPLELELPSQEEMDEEDWVDIEDW
jgi:hypothetical protein